MKRRFFLFAAPAIVAAPSLMRVSTAAIIQPAYDIATYQRYSGYDPILTEGDIKWHMQKMWEEVVVANANRRQRFLTPEEIKAHNITAESWWRPRVNT